MNKIVRMIVRKSKMEIQKSGTFLVYDDAPDKY